MGRIKTTQVKRSGRKLVSLYGSKFTNDFDKNKKSVAERTIISSKKLRNIIAGYVTRLTKKQQPL